MTPARISLDDELAAAALRLEPLTAPHLGGSLSPRRSASRAMAVLPQHRRVRIAIYHGRREPRLMGHAASAPRRCTVVSCPVRNVAVLDDVEVAVLEPKTPFSASFVQSRRPLRIAFERRLRACLTSASSPLHPYSPQETRRSLTRLSSSSLCSQLELPLSLLLEAPEVESRPALYLAAAAQLPPFPLPLFLRARIMPPTRCVFTLSSQPLLLELPFARIASPYSMASFRLRALARRLPACSLPPALWGLQHSIVAEGS
ncbi:hypothetical protein B0H15DRAFT_993672 [Mycena belliarum]|uniref:Uncharacterized protein n=1 Tax=Mycena belliarum TaxID=1033014 RepID=A0AAD6XRD9_9AGAR|nr:hypothetical protein B0H15DRAFT_993672 [Mycena belliae]